MTSRNSLVEFFTRALVAVTALTAAAGVALAQDPAPPAAPEAPEAPAAPQAQASPAAPQSPWLKVCNKHPETGADLCVLTQELRAESGQPIANVTIQIGQDGKYGIGAVVPIGFVLPPGIDLVVDGTKQGTAQYVICTPRTANAPPVCLAQAAVNEDFITSLKKGNKLALVVLTRQNKQIPIELTLAGFSKAFDGPGIDRAAAEAQRKQLSDALQKSAEEARKKLIEQQQKELGNAAN